MKNSQSIISNIKNKKQFKKLRDLQELNKLKIFLPLEIRQVTSSIFFRHNKLMFVIHHLGFVNEFNRYIRHSIRESLKMHKVLFPPLAGVNIADIEILAYSPKYIINQFEGQKEIPKPMFYGEHSYGEFQNFSTNIELKTLFENIREIILKSRLNVYQQR